jgi:hypothetical protein
VSSATPAQVIGRAQAESHAADEPMTSAAGDSNQSMTWTIFSSGTKLAHRQILREGTRRPFDISVDVSDAD